MKARTNLNLTPEERDWLVSMPEYQSEEGQLSLSLHVGACSAEPILSMILLSSIATELGITPPFHEDAYKKLVRITERMGVELRVTPHPSLRYGGYDPHNHRIVVNSALDDATAVIVLSHEVAHSLINYRQPGADVTDKERAEWEIAAQTTAHLLLRKLGVQEFDHSAIYVRHYLEETTLEALPKAAGIANAAARSLASLAS